MAGLYKLFILMLFLSGCPDPVEECYKNYYLNITNYQVIPNITTSNSFKLDTQEISPYSSIEDIDKILSKLEQCVFSVVSTINPITNEDKDRWQCLENNISTRFPVKKNCFAIKFVKSILSSCSNWEFLDIIAPDDLCLSKGIIPTQECPCRWRLAVQNDNFLITPPAFYYWDIIRIWTGCNNIWETPFVKCLQKD